MATTGVEKSFVVIDGDLRLLLEYEDGWYTASSLDVRGLNTQGRTVEEALENAHDAAKLLAEDRAAMMREVRASSKKARARTAAARSVPTRSSRPARSFRRRETVKA